MKALVTGGCGFIGSHLVDELQRRGHDVVVVDNLVSGRRENLAKIADILFYQADIRDIAAIRKAFVGVDWVFHLAGLADIVPSIEEPDRYVSTNVMGTLNVLECARDAKAKRFVYAASSSCYGIPSITPRLKRLFIAPQYPYALSKYMGEELVLHWAKTYHLPALSLRLFNVYGPRSRTSGAYGAVFGVFLSQKLHGKPFTVVGDGMQTRDFTFVTDVARAFATAAESRMVGEVFNVGSGDHYTIRRLVELLGGPVTYVPKRPGEPDCTFADIAKIQRQLGWNPTVSLQEGVQRMLESMDLWRDAPVWDEESIKKATATWFQFLGGGPRGT